MEGLNEEQREDVKEMIKEGLSLSVEFDGDRDLTVTISFEGDYVDHGYYNIPCSGGDSYYD